MNNPWKQTESIYQIRYADDDNVWVWPCWSEPYSEIELLHGQPDDFCRQVLALGVDESVVIEDFYDCILKRVSGLPLEVRRVA